MSENNNKGCGREATQFKPWNKAASKYKEKYADEMYEYFNVPPTHAEPIVEMNKNGVEVTVGREIIPTDYPTFEGFAAKIGVDTDTLRNWCEEHDRFRHCYAWAREKQREILLVNGIAGRYNPNFAKFVAINCHGMQEKVATENTGPVQVHLSGEVDEEAN